jgi:hypothetical protein
LVTNTIFWTNFNQQTLNVCMLGSSSSGTGSIQRCAIAGWTNGNNEIRSCAKTGCTTAMTVVGGLSGIEGYAFDGSALYYAHTGSISMIVL